MENQKENAPQTPSAPNLTNLILNKWHATFTLGGKIDQNSFVLMEQTFLEYEITLKNMAIFALFGNKDAFDQMTNQLNDLIRTRESLIVAALKGVLSETLKAKAQIEAEANIAKTVDNTQNPIV